MPQKLYTVYQVADLLGSTPGEVLAWIREGRLDCRGDDGQRRIPQAGLVQFLKSEGIDIEQVLAKAVLGASADAPPADGDAPKAPAYPKAPADGPVRPTADPLAAADDADNTFADFKVPDRGKYVADVVARPPADLRPPAGADLHEADGAAPATPVDVEPALDAEIVAADPDARLAEAILKDAVARRATAIHLEPAEGGLALRLRVDGVLQEKVNFRLRLPPAVAQGLVAHFMRRAGLADEASSKDGPGRAVGEQAGWFTSPASTGGGRFRLTICPTRAGRRLVIFPPDSEADRLALADLGLESGDQRTLRRLLHERSGLILVTARPGDGAGTTLRAMAGELAGRERSLFWIGPEDRPPIDGASQIALANPSPFEGAVPPSGRRSGIPARHSAPGTDECRASMPDLQAAEAIRLAAAQDPDVIAIAEIWDSQTLLAAAEAALAGSLVLARLHERMAPAALDLLRKTGLAPWRLATALLAVVAQTTVRKLCPACRREGPPSDAALDRLGLRGDDAARSGAPFVTFVPGGCKRCFNTGYAGRTGVFSILEVTGDLAGLLREGANAAALSEAAAKAGMKTLPQAAMELARRGDATLEELARIV